MTAPLAIDLCCGLDESEFGLRADASVEQLVACGAENPEHVPLPLAVDLCAGLCGWGEGLISEGWRVRAYDIEDMFAALGEPQPEHVELVLRNVLEMHGSEIADADLIVASPPCTEYSYMAMPWKRSKQIARALRGEDEFPEPYRGSRTVEQLNAIFDACFRLQREASEAAGRHIPMVVENVKGAQPWVGRAAWSFGSFYLWGDVPALMPNPRRLSVGDGLKRTGRTMCFPAGSANPDAVRGRTGKLHWQDEEDGRKNPGFRFDGSGGSFQSESVNRRGVKQPGLSGTRENGKGDRWFQDGAAKHGSRSPARKAASAKIAKIPLALSTWIARCYRPRSEAA